MKLGIFAFLFGSTFSFAKGASGYTAFECLGNKTDKFYDATILDVGDQEGAVVINNGGAPKSFKANYHEIEDGQHRWVFGFELYNEGTSPVLSELNITINPSRNPIGKVSYFEHDGDAQLHELISETLSCRAVSE
jgi:hypothetical protein